MLPLRSGICWELEERATRLLEAERRFNRRAYPDEYTFDSINDWLTDDQLALRESREVLNPLGVPDPGIVQGQYSRAYPLDRYGYHRRPRWRDRLMSRMDPWRQAAWEEVESWLFTPGEFIIPGIIASSPTTDHLERYLEDYTVSLHPTNSIFAPRETPVETWRLLRNYPPFEVSNTAKVRNSHTGVELRQFIADCQGKKSPGGGWSVRLPKGKKEHIRNVRSLVREYFGAEPIAIPEPRKTNSRQVATTVDPSPRLSDLSSTAPVPNDSLTEEEPMTTTAPIAPTSLDPVSDQPTCLPLPKNREYVDGYTINTLGEVFSPQGNKLVSRTYTLKRSGHKIVLVELREGTFTAGNSKRILKQPVALLMLKTFGPAQPGPNYRPGYKDGNPENVRRTNLFWEEGPALQMKRRQPQQRPSRTKAFLERQQLAQAASATPTPTVDKPTPQDHQKGHEALFASNQPLRQQLVELQEQLAQAQQTPVVTLGPEKIIGFPIQVGGVVGTLGATSLSLDKTVFGFEELADLKKLITRARKHLAIEQEDDEDED